MSSSSEEESGSSAEESDDDASSSSDDLSNKNQSFGEHSQQDFVTPAKPKAAEGPEEEPPSPGTRAIQHFKKALEEETAEATKRGLTLDEYRQALLDNSVHRGGASMEENRRRLKKYVAASSRELHSMACLLYTSPSPRDGLLSRMPSSA